MKKFESIEEARTMMCPLFGKLCWADRCVCWEEEVIRYREGFWDIVTLGPPKIKNTGKFVCRKV